MGIGALFKGLSATVETTSKEDEDKGGDRRKRNSLLFYITQSVELPLSSGEHNENDPESANKKAAIRHERENTCKKLLELIKEEKDELNPLKGKKVRETKFTKIAKAVLAGNMKVLKNEVIVNFATINRKYKDQYLGNCLIHFVCQEGIININNKFSLLINYFLIINLITNN